MRERCEILVVVRSRRVVVAAHERQVALPLSAGPAGTVYVPVRGFALRYRRRLDPVHAAALAEARRLATESGESLRVIDLGRGNPLVRFLRARFLRAHRLPVVILKGACSWHRLAAEEPQRPPHTVTL